MGKSIKSESRRPLLVVLFFIFTVSAAYYSFVNFGYYWTVLLPNILLLYVTTVLLFVYLDHSGSYDVAQNVKDFPQVTVIIPSYNCKRTIEKTIESVRSADYPNKIEIMVIDDGSTDGTREMLQRMNGIKLILKERNEGKAAALNEGIRLAKNEYIFCIDSDTYVHKDALKLMVAKMASDDRMGAVTCFVKVANNKSFLSRVQEIEYFIGFGFAALTNYLLEAVFVTPGPMTLFRKSVLIKAGLFDTNNITEDLEIAWRLRKFGYKIGYAYEAEVYTEVPENLKSFWRQRTRWYRGKLFNIVKYKDMLFNPKYGYFGVFVLPFSLASEIAALATIYFLAYVGIFTLLWNIKLLSTYIATNSLSIANLMTGMFGSSSGIFMFIIMILPWLATIVISYRLGRRKITWGDAPVFAFFLFVYSIVVSAIYVYSVCKEIYGSDYNW